MNIQTDDNDNDDNDDVDHIHHSFAITNYEFSKIIIIMILNIVKQTMHILFASISRRI